MCVVPTGSSCVSSQLVKLALQEWSPSKVASAIGTNHPCELCDYISDSKHKLALHLFNQHQTGRLLGNYIDTECCLICLPFFGSRQKTIVHVQESSKRCRLAILETLKMLSLDVFAALDKVDAADLRRRAKLGYNHRTALSRFSRLQDPHSHVAMDRGIHHRTLLKHRMPLDVSVIQRAFEVQCLNCP